MHVATGDYAFQGTVGRHVDHHRSRPPGTSYRKFFPIKQLIGIRNYQWTDIHEDTLSVMSEDPSVKLGEGNPELGTFWKVQIDIALSVRFPPVTVQRTVLRIET